jgi:pimeloyl-ACP methyl ester carboxylesterase
MQRMFLPCAPGRIAPLRIILLPGATHQPEDFVRAGFGAAVTRRGLALDVEFVAPELEHLLDRSLLDRLHAEVVGPARAAGVRELWLGGISLGAFLALLQAQRDPRGLDGLCLLAPYLGNRSVTGAIARAGGLQAWRPGPVAQPGPLALADEERQVWTFLQSLPLQGLPVYLGLARQDRFFPGQDLLAAALPPGVTEIIDGVHDWSAWRELWERFLDRLAAAGLASHP